MHRSRIRGVRIGSVDSRTARVRVSSFLALRAADFVDLRYEAGEMIRLYSDGSIHIYRGFARDPVVVRRATDSHP